MKKAIIFTIISLSLAFTSQAYETLILEGQIPGQYLGKAKTKTHPGAVVMYAHDHKDKKLRGLIADVLDLSTQAGKTALSTYTSASGAQHIALSNDDVIYPGLIDLHNHTKQNNLGVWSEAKGQFANRFEWRAWGVYKKSVSGNMNPWIGFGKAITCSAFRWSEIQAMTVGTTYLQGPSSCVNNFAIHQVENSKAYPHSSLKSVQAPTDLVIPGDMTFVWQVLKPLIDKDKKNPNAYEAALAKTINANCDTKQMGGKFTVLGVREKGIDPKTGGLDLLTDQDLLKKHCKGKGGQLHNKFIRYVYWVHKSVIGKKKYAESLYSKDNTSGTGSAIIAHLAEGRRTDIYNTREFEIVKLLGMDQPHVNFVHGVGVDSEELKSDNFQHMADRQMGLIWSPFSNFILYNETLDVAKAIDKGVMMALGSDWLPTGTKGPLEELKVAYKYVDKEGLKSALKKMNGAGSADEALYKMVTENPAKMINHWQTGSNDPDWENGEDKGGIGTLAPNAMGSVIVTSKLHNNPYTNLVREVWETDVNLVVVDGKIQYGNTDYLDAANLDYESIPNVRSDGKAEFNMAGIQSAVDDNLVLLKQNPDPKKDDKADFLEKIAKVINGNSDKVKASINCQFSGEKGFVHQETKDGALLGKVMNLDRFKDIQRLIGINLMTQSRNRNNPEKGDVNFQPEYFTPLYTCNDQKHYDRVNDFISKTWATDSAGRDGLIQTQKLGKVPDRLAEQYK